MGGRKKRVVIDDHSNKHKSMNSIWRPVSTNASSCQGLSFLSIVSITSHYVFDMYDFFYIIIIIIIII